MEINNFPFIFDIKRGSHEDGPGIRSVVFFKGCPLRCIFCHNPEAQDQEMEVAFYGKECIHCGKCADACPEGAIDLELPGRIKREECIRCGDCINVCPGNGLRIIGKYYSVEPLTEILLRDLSFYIHSGGGVTLSGGECTLYPDYLNALIKSLKDNGLHVVLETSGFFEYETFSRNILPYVDLIYYDIKIANPEAHRRYTGKSNQIILDNLKQLFRQTGVKVHPRIPFVPGITATRENLKAIIDILCEAGAEDVSLLPYNPMGLEMSVKLGKPKPHLPERFMKPDEEGEVYAMFKSLFEEKDRRLGKVLPRDKI